MDMTLGLIAELVGTDLTQAVAYRVEYV